MTPEEKAKELVEKFQKAIPDYLYKGVELNMNAKQCALIAVDEIMYDVNGENLSYDGRDKQQYWQAVKSEISKL